MTNEVLCPYREPCSYSATNCDGSEFPFCAIFAKYANEEYQRLKAQKESLREIELTDIGLVRPRKSILDRTFKESLDAGLAG